RQRCALHARRDRRPGRGRVHLLPDEPRYRPHGGGQAHRGRLLRRGDRAGTGTRGPGDRSGGDRPEDRAMTTQSTTAPGTFDARKVKQDFPILQQTIHGKPLTYLDSAASSQKPSVVIEALDAYYRASNANIHRGVYWLSERATALYDEAREKVARFINAPDARSCVFVRNATEALNLVAYSWGRANLGPGDTVVLTLLEHHSNIV